MSGKYILNIKSYRIPCTNFVFCPKILRSPERFDHKPLFCISEGKYCPKMGNVSVPNWAVKNALIKQNKSFDSYIVATCYVF